MWPFRKTIPPWKKSLQSLPVRFDEIKQLIESQTDRCLKELNKLPALWTKQPRPVEDQLREGLVEAMRSVFVKALQQQLGTSVPGQISQTLESIEKEITASVKSEVGTVLGLLNETLDRKLGEVNPALKEISRFNVLLEEYQRLKIEAEAARQVLAEKSIVIAERDRAIEARDMACRLEKILESFTQHAFEARNDAKAIQLRNEKLNHELDEKSRLLNQREEAIEPAELKLLEEKRRLDELISAVTARENLVTRQREEWETARARHETEMRSLAKQVEKDKQQAEEQQKEAQRTYSETLSLLGRFWPEFLLVGDWDDWRATLQNEAVTNLNAALLLAAFHSFSAAFHGGERELLFDGLRQIGLLHYRFLKGRGLGEADVAQETERLARHFNQNSQQRFRLEVARPGLPTDSAWMNFQPGLTTVSTVSSWAVFDPSETGPRHRAIVQGTRNDK